MDKINIGIMGAGKTSTSHELIKEILENKRYEKIGRSVEKLATECEQKIKHYEKRIMERNRPCYHDETERIKAYEEHIEAHTTALEYLNRALGIN